MRNLILSLLALFVSLGFSTPAFSFTPDTDCVIDNFDTQIQLNADSSAKINETLRVDCGNLPDKHGIFRILPTKLYRATQVWPYTPIKLISITNGTGKPYNFETINDKLNHNLTWKIGDANTTITGINIYQISYIIKNVVVPSDNGDALYLNLNGNFWELPTNNFTGTIHLPDGINQTNTQIQLYAGEFGVTGSEFAKFKWSEDGKSFQVTANDLPPSVGITTWAEFLSGLVKLYQPSWWERNGIYLWLLLPLYALWLGLREWRRHGQDPRFRGPIVVEYDPPKDLLPLEGGLLMNYGNLKPVFVSATIIDLAVRGYLKIEEIKSTGFLMGQDWQITLLKDNFAELKPFETRLLNTLLGNNATVGTSMKLSDQKDTFYTEMTGIRTSAYEKIKSFFDADGASWQITFIGLGSALMFASVPIGITLMNWVMLASLMASGIILIIFGILMSKRSKLGSETLYQLKGFQLYMKQAETYRMRFYEKENIFEKYLPYAIIFGLTHIWAKAFAKIYEEKYHTSYIPIWYIATSGNNFSIDSFATNLSSLSSNMASTLASSPKSSGGGFGGGGGFSGGGAGGGGGGSW
jgi:uncharacterized membrane protein